MEYEKFIKQMNERLQPDKSFDIIRKELSMGGRKGSLYFIDGFTKDEVYEKILEFFIKMKPEDFQKVENGDEFSRSFVPYVETDVSKSVDECVKAVLCGSSVLVVEGIDSAFIIDTRTYPVRGVEEPEDDKVLRGSHDGFTETIVFNTALIRRRIRDPRLRMDIHSVGSRSKTDVVLCYMDSIADEKVVNYLKKKLDSIKIGSLTMAQESLAECLVRKQWFNPYPKSRYTERPDAACASVLEGKILIIVDNSPSVMVLPVSIFDFIQDTNDYYFPPVVGTYLRLVRLIVFSLTLLLTPVWYLMIKNPQLIPSWLDFIKIDKAPVVPILAQLLILEFMIDALKLASLNTPSALGNSFSLIGALLLGDFAVKANWFIPEVLLYMSFVAISNFTQPSFELGYAFKLSRIFMLIIISFSGIWGFFISLIIVLLVLSFTKTATGRCYLFPLIPFNGYALSSLFIRKPISRKNS